METENTNYDIAQNEFMNIFKDGDMMVYVTHLGWYKMARILQMIFPSHFLV